MSSLSSLKTPAKNWLVLDSHNENQMHNYEHFVLIVLILVGCVSALLVTMAPSVNIQCVISARVNMGQHVCILNNKFPMCVCVLTAGMVTTAVKVFLLNVMNFACLSTSLNQSIELRKMQ